MSKFQDIKNLLPNNELRIALELTLEIANELNSKKYGTEPILYSAQYNQNEKDYSDLEIEKKEYSYKRGRISILVNKFLTKIEEELEATVGDDFYHELIFDKSDYHSYEDFKNSYLDKLEIPKPTSLDKNDIPKSKGKETILFLSANPTDSGRLQVGKEFSEINNSMRNNKHYNLLNPEFALTKKNLIIAMNDKPQIIHFAGHGKQKKDGFRKKGVIIISHENNIKEQEMSTRAFMMQFKQHKERIRLIVLNACYSAIQAKTFSTIGAYVIGMNNEVKDTTSIDFAKGIYTGLSLGKSIENAFYDAMTMIDDSDADLPKVWKDGEEVNWL